MARIVNPNINPQATYDYALDLMPSRSKRIKKVSRMITTGVILGQTNSYTGEVQIPSDLTALARMVRFHEGLHVQFTSRKFKAADRLDQALEDARIHRWCSKSVSSRYTRARRDELVIALRDLRQSARAPRDRWNVTFSVGIVRAFAIIHQSDITPARERLLKRVCQLLGPTAWRDILLAVASLERARLPTDANWLRARKILAKYFTRDFTPRAESVPNEDTVKKSDESEDSSDRAESVPNEDKSADADADTAGGESSDPKELDTCASDATDGGDLPIPEDMAPPVIPHKSKSRKILPDEYTADLTPAIDRERYREMAAKYPLKLFIRRLDMGTNRVKTEVGRRAPLPVLSGARICAGKLVAARTTPATRLFERRANKGQGGTILIDASGSMSIPEKTLIDFCGIAPLMTIGFYNAPADSSKYGTIFLYAANGYRANLHFASFRASCPDYGSGNVIDYQAIAWLLKQPAPRYMVGDWGFTGKWWAAALHCYVKAIKANQIFPVPSLAAMKDVLAEVRHVTPLDYYKRYFADNLTAQRAMENDL